MSSRIQVKPKELIELADLIKAEREEIITDPKNRLLMTMSTLSGVKYSERAYQSLNGCIQAVDHYLAKLEENMIITKNAADDFRTEDEKEKDQIKHLLYEFIGFNDLRRLGEYDPITHEKITGKDRSIAMLSLTGGRFLKVLKIPGVKKFFNTLSNEFIAEKVASAWRLMKHVPRAVSKWVSNGDKKWVNKWNKGKKGADVGKGTPNPSMGASRDNELSRIDYLHNKYGKLTSEQLNERINLRGETFNELQKLHASGISKKRMGPAFAGVYDKTTGKYHFAINDYDGELPNFHPVIQKKYDSMPKEVLDSYEFTKGSGSHAEVIALNDALKANPNASSDNIIVNVIRTGQNKTKPAGMMFPRCPHCAYLTDGFEFITEVPKNVK